MKRIAALFCLLLMLLLTAFAVTAEGDTVSFDAMTIAKDGNSVTAHITLPAGFANQHDTLYLFRVSANHSGSLSAMTPIAEQEVTGTTLTITIPYDARDPAAALYGYVLARSDGNGGFLPMSKVVYPENFSAFAPHTKAYPTVTSKKGLQVQLITDAQLLGVKHTVVNAFFNELITESEAQAEAFVYGGETYYLDTATLSALDYRIKSLTDAGIHVYLNYLLAFDTSASSALYYPKAEGNASTLYAPNVSTPDGIRRYAAVMHFLASRYSQPNGKYGFCGSYILGYEVNQEGERHSMGLIDITDFAEQYAILLRTADTAVRTAYANGRVFVSLSNRWDVSSDEELVPYLFGARDLLDELAKRCSDIPFGISVNPYPSELSMTDYWNDSKATDDLETAYLTVKNLSVLTEYVKNSSLLYKGHPRPVIVGEFGLSGKTEQTEELQAAAYLMAYATVCRNEGIEAFIWHRHVDHAGEKGLYYGLYASSDLLLEPTTPKLLHTVFATVDTDGLSARIRERLLPHLPEGSEDPFAIAPNREVIAVTANGKYSEQNSTILFDFSQSLYGFYPTDNAAYLEQWEEEGHTFLRTALIHISSKEYMGIGIPLSDLSHIQHADAITLRLRVVSGLDTADIRLLLSGEKEGQEIVLDGTATVVCDEWVDVTFPLNTLATKGLSSGNMKIWTRFDSGANEELYLDVDTVILHTARETGVLGIVLLILLAIALISSLIFLHLFAVSRRRKHHSA